MANLTEIGRSSPNLLDRLTEALDDERKAIATYRSVIERFGPVRPFVNIIEAERRHAAALIGLFDRYGLPVPEDDWAMVRVAVPESLPDACSRAVAGELQNIAMYDHLLDATPEPEVRRVLERLQSASRDRHLPAFQRCLGSGSRMAGAGRGQGRGGRRCRGGH
jgi:rubrerythrin